MDAQQIIAQRVRIAQTILIQIVRNQTIIGPSHERINEEPFVAMAICILFLTVTSFPFQNPFSFHPVLFPQSSH